MASFGTGLYLGLAFNHHHHHDFHHYHDRPQTVYQSTTYNNYGNGYNGNGNDYNDYNNNNRNGNRNPNNNNVNTSPNNNNLNNNANVAPNQNIPNNNNNATNPPEQSMPIVYSEPVQYKNLDEKEKNNWDSTEMIFTNAYLVVGFDNLLLYGEMQDDYDTIIIIQQDSDGLSPFGQSNATSVPLAPM